MSVLFTLSLVQGAKVHTVEQLDVDLSLVPIGATVAFHNPYWKRYIKLASATVAGASSTNTNASPLPSGWTHERFLVVDAGNGLVALHNAIHNGFLKVTSNGLCQGYGASVSDLGPEWLNERFKVVDAGPGRIALWSPMWGKYVKMHDTQMKADATAIGEWEEFTPVIVNAGNPLQPLIGHTIALHNAHHNRFIKMNSGGVTRSDAKDKDQLPAAWDEERFTVVDAGNNRIALYNRKHNRFVKIPNGGPVASSPTIDANSPPVFPSGWGAEALSAEDVGDGQIALKGTYFGRYMRMHYTGVDSEATTPATWERYTVVRTQHPLISVLLGRSVALHNAHHNRLLKMTGSTIDRSPTVNVNSIPSYYASERFSLVDAGDGKIGLHTPYYNKFMAVQSNMAMSCSAEKDANLPLRDESLSFTAVDCGQGAICLRVDFLNRFVSMRNSDVYATGQSTAAWERFTVVEFDTAMAFLVGKTVGLHSPSVNRFLMFSFNDVVASEPTNINNFPYEWSSGRFKVQFAGNGRVTLYNEGEGAYVVVHSNGHVNIARRTYQQPPPNEADMQFQVVDVQGGGVALKSVPHNRHVRMSVVQTTPATGCIEFGHKVVIAQTFDHHNQCGWYGCRVAFMGSDNHMYFGHGGMDPTSFYIRPVPGSNQQGCVSYGDTVAIAYSAESGANGCGWYGCRVGAMVNNVFVFGHGVAANYFYIRPPPNGQTGSVSYGDRVVIAFTSNAGDTSNCGWYGCRVAAMWGNNQMGFGHGNGLTQFQLNPFPPTVVVDASTSLGPTETFELLTVKLMDENVNEDAWEVFVGMDCEGEPYSRDRCDLSNCDGWGGANAETCKQKCDNNEVPPGCPQNMQCHAFTWGANNWCQLYSGCETLHNNQGIVAYRRANPTLPALLQVQDDVSVESFGPDAELASSFPFVMMNLSNFSGLITNESHPGIQHRFGNVTKDLNLLYEKVEGFYAILHERMGADGPVYCPLQSYMHLPTCITIATCLLQSSVPQHISMAFYSSIMEQAARFEDVTWQVIESALSFESHGQQTLIRDAVPSKYRCDAFEEASKVVEGPTYPEPSNHTGHALVEVSHGASKASATLAFSAALHGATRSMHRILDSHHLNSSLDATLGNLEDLWRPICEQLGCDPSNYWEIFLSTHQQTMALLQTSAAATMRKEILQRAQLERRVQRFVGEHGEALRGRLWRPYEEGPAVESGKAYAEKGRAAVLQLVPAVVKTLAKVDARRAMRFLDQVELKKYVQRKAESQGKILDSKELLEAEVALTLKTSNTWFIDNWPGGLKCFGKFSLFYTQGYYKSIVSSGAFGATFAFGLSAGVASSLEQLVYGLEPAGWFSFFMSFSAGLAAGPPTGPWFWSGMCASGTLQCGCGPCEFSLTVGAVAIVATEWTNGLVCPIRFPPATGIKCSQGAGVFFTTFCCKVNMVTGAHDCR